MSLIAGIVLLICGFNALFLEKYYVKVQQKSILRTFNAVKETIKDDSIDEDLLDQVVREVSREQNMKLLIVDSNFTPVYGVRTDMNQMLRWLQDYMFQDTIDGHILESNDVYIIRTSDNKYDKASYLEIIGHDDAYLYNIIIQIPIESISKSVRISNYFLFIVGLIVAIIGGIIAYFAAGLFTGPIKKLSKTAEEMSTMNFDVKYEANDKSEIGVLGNSLNKMSDSLKQYISDLKMANLRLEDDIKQKEKLDEMRRDFISNVSHELKTPIALISGYAEGLREGITDDPENIEFYCEVIEDEASKMNKMVRSLLTLNQLESGEDMLNIERFDIAKHIEELVKTNSIRADQKNVTIDYSYNGPVYVWADQFRIEEVLTNYISNAINHVAPVDGREGNISVKIVDNNNGTVSVHVFNTGKHIPEESLDQIWEKFYKVDKARTREYGGNGVGLSIVKAIMELHHQQYGVNNVEGGVDFYFTLDCENA